jgi:hypothetical protein
MDAALVPRGAIKQEIHEIVMNPAMRTVPAQTFPDAKRPVYMKTVIVGWRLSIPQVIPSFTTFGHAVGWARHE